MQWPWRARVDVVGRLATIEALLITILKQGGLFMAQIDDLKNALQGALDRLDSMQVKLDDVQGDLQELIDAIPQDLTEVVAMANAVREKVEAMGTDLDSTPDPDAEPPAEG